MLRTIAPGFLLLLAFNGCLLEVELSGEPPPMCSSYDEGFDTTTEMSETCTLTLTAGAVTKSTETCWVDEVVTAAPGVLTYPCAGGPATATFGDKSFFGVVDGDRVELCTRTEFDWEDGCHWQSAQHISGSIASGELRYEYSEAPDAEQADCASACTAEAELDAAE
jgi:hypothetical protein